MSPLVFTWSLIPFLEGQKCTKGHLFTKTLLHESSLLYGLNFVLFLLICFCYHLNLWSFFPNNAAYHLLLLLLTITPIPNTFHCNFLFIFFTLVQKQPFVQKCLGEYSTRHPQKGIKLQIEKEGSNIKIK